MRPWHAQGHRPVSWCDDWAVIVVSLFLIDWLDGWWFCGSGEWRA